VLEILLLSILGLVFVVVFRLVYIGSKSEIKLVRKEEKCDGCGIKSGNVFSNGWYLFLCSKCRKVQDDTR